jgi:uncharacterized membrane protein YjjB (DUF3815 family)
MITNVWQVSSVQLARVSPLIPGIYVLKPTTVLLALDTITSARIQVITRTMNLMHPQGALKALVMMVRILRRQY